MSEENPDLQPLLNIILPVAMSAKPTNWNTVRFSSYPICWLKWKPIRIQGRHRVLPCINGKPMISLK